MISAIILNYFNPPLTVKSVDALLKAASETKIPVEVIVVDNSAPTTAKELRLLLPSEAVIIENEENRGFAAANNQGIKQAGGEVILIMNNDLFINKEVLKKGYEYATANRKCGIWAPKLTDQFGNAQRTCSHFPSLRGVISEYLTNQQLDNQIAILANGVKQPMQVDTVIGACMFIRREVLQEVGLFDEDYFFTSEDMDLCFKVDKAGYEIIFDPRCEAIHLTGASQNSLWHEDAYLHETRKLYFKKHHHYLKALLAGFVIDCGIKLRKLKHRFI